MKFIEGFVRDHPGGNPLSGVDVTIRDDVDGSPIPSGGMIRSSQNPTVTNQDGFFTWSTELSPGPLKVEADINAGVEVKVRNGKEVMQAGEIFVSDLSQLNQVFASGIFADVGNEFAVSGITGQRAIRVKDGAANMDGRFLKTDTDREIAISSNTTLGTRRDLVVLEQHLGGDYIGKQNIGIVEGTVDNTDPATNTDPDIMQMPIARVKILLNGTTVTTEDMRLYAGPTALAEGTVTMPTLAQDVLDYIASQFPGFSVLDDGAVYLATTKILNFGNGFTLTKTGTDRVNLSVDAVDPTVVTSGKYSGEKNFPASGLATGSARVLGSASVIVPAGTWLIRTMIQASVSSAGSSGRVRFFLSGSGTPQGADQSSRGFGLQPWQTRQIILTGRVVKTVTSTTTFTATANVIHDSGAQMTVEDGNVHIEVV